MCFELLCWAYVSPRSSAAVVGFWNLLGRAAWCEVALGVVWWHQLSSAAVSQLDSDTALKGSQPVHLNLSPAWTLCIPLPAPAAPAEAGSL